MTDTLKTVEIVEFAPCGVWIESDMFGARHVMLHHQGHGDPFTYATFHYNYAYTSNAQTRSEAEKLAIELGAKEPVQEKVREWKMPAELSELTRERAARQAAESRVAELEQQLRDAVAAERERCAKVCEDAMPILVSDIRSTLVDCAAAIREGAPAREWRGLSGEGVDAVIRSVNLYPWACYIRVARAIEAALRERNA